MLRRAWQEAPGNIRVMGRGHSFNDICNTDGTLINLTRRMNQVLELNADSRTLRVQGGITYTGMFEYLRDTEWALPNTASMPHFSLSGAISTGVHGSSGVDPVSGRPYLGNLGSAVKSLTLVIHDGSTVRVSRDDADGGAKLNTAIVGLGCLGVVAEVELDLVSCRYRWYLGCILVIWVAFFSIPAISLLIGADVQRRAELLPRYPGAEPDRELPRAARVA